MPLTPEQLDALNRAEPLIQERDYRRYLRLKELLPQEDEASRVEFQRIFRSYYGLNVAGLGTSFLDAFFEALFHWNGNRDVRALLHRLYEIPNLRGRNTLQLSFVSKLVAIHDESRPIYDRHVREFFDMAEPSVNTPIDDRITWWIGFLNQVQAAYQEWVANGEVVPILNRLRDRDPNLAACNPVRLVDFLVWKAGNSSLLKIVKHEREIEALASEIEAIPNIQERIDRVAEDHDSGKNRYSEIDVWKLASLLDVDFENHGDWDRTYWGRKRQLVDDWATCPYAENIHCLEDRVPKDRFLELSEIAEAIQNGEQDDDLPLTPEEIKSLEEAYSEQPPDFPCLEHIVTTVYSTNQHPLYFSATVGDAGAIEYPMSPYDHDEYPEFDPDDQYIEMY